MPDPPPEASTTAEVATLRRRTSRALLASGAALILALAVAGFAFADPATSDRPQAPAFSLTLLDGQTTISSEDLRGHPTVINAWASWCPPCREEAPTLERVSNDLAPEGVQFLGVVQDDTVASATEYAADAGLDYPHALDDGSFDAAFDVPALPTTFVLDADGGIVAKHTGPISESRLRLLIAEAMHSTAEGAAEDAE